MRARAVIVTPFPSVEETAAELGIGKARVERITRLMEQITQAPGRGAAVGTRGTKAKMKRKSTR